MPEVEGVPPSAFNPHVGATRSSLLPRANSPNANAAQKAYKAQEAIILIAPALLAFWKVTDLEVPGRVSGSEA